jgi:hypothetical protein
VNGSVDTSFVNDSVGRECVTRVWDASVGRECGTRVWDASVGAGSIYTFWKSICVRIAYMLDVRAVLPLRYDE